MEEIKKRTRKPQKKRNDRVSNINKVAKVVLANPNMKQAKLAKLAWVSQWTISNTLEELNKLNKNPQIVQICAKDLEIIQVAQDLALEKLMDKKYNKKIRVSEIASLISDNTRRYTLFKWDITNNDWWLNQMIAKSDLELLAMLDG